MKQVNELNKIDLSFYLKNGNDTPLSQELNAAIKDALSEAKAFINANQANQFIAIKAQQKCLSMECLVLDDIRYKNAQNLEDFYNPQTEFTYKENDILTNIKACKPLEINMIEVIVALFIIKFYKLAIDKLGESTPSVSEPKQDVLKENTKGKDVAKRLKLFGELLENYKDLEKEGDKQKALAVLLGVSERTIRDNSSYKNLRDITPILPEILKEKEKR
jgi:hypothetical protein